MTFKVFLSHFAALANSRTSNKIDLQFLKRPRSNYFLRTNRKTWLSGCEEGLKRLELFFCLKRTYQRSASNVSVAASLCYLVAADLVSHEHSPLSLLSDLLGATVQGELKPLASATCRLEGTVEGAFFYLEIVLTFE